MKRTPRHWALLAVALAAGIALIFYGVEQPINALRGWLAAFVWAVWIPLGALALMLVHRITGGAWGEDLAPVLVPAAKAIFPVALLSVPILVFSPLIYYWQSPEMPVSVAAHYMNGPFFAVRTLALLSSLSLLAWFAGLRGTLHGAALSLLGVAITANILPVDWVVSTQPGFYSSAFGFGFGIEAIFAALGLCALLGVQGEAPRACRDLSGLILAALLGTAYFVYVQFVVIWYGDLPEKAVWYVVRSSAPWPQMGGAGLAVGGLFPFLALLNKDVRESPFALRLIGAGILIGVTLHALWLVVPSFETAVLVPAVLGMVLIGALFTLWLESFGVPWRPLPLAKDAPHHG